MSYRNRSERPAARFGFRTMMDLGMGLFYAVIGTLILVYKSFGNMEIPAFIAYILGGMMVIGGIFRLVKGIKALGAAKPDFSRTDEDETNNGNAL